MIYNKQSKFINRQLESANSGSNAMDEARVGYVHHKIDQDHLRAGDHIYVHEHGGLTNKHGIVVRLNGELRVIHKQAWDCCASQWRTQSDSQMQQVSCCPLKLSR